MKHLLVDISGHGFGHLAQTACVLNALLPDVDILHITIRTSLPEKIVKQRIKVPFNYQHYEMDKGMVMKNAVQVDIQASLVWYQQQHANYAGWLQTEMENLTFLKPDLLFSNIPYISIDAAAQLGIKTFALCSLNWFDILKSYIEQNQIRDDYTQKILQQIKQAYYSADYFFRPQPSLLMPELTNTREISPLVVKGRSQRSVLSDAFSDYCTEDKFVLVSMGGISSPFALERWPVIPGIKWIMPDSMMQSFTENSAMGLTRPDLLSHKNIPLNFIDTLVSSDLVFTKTGYGTLVEAITHQKPVLCVERGDWPEEEVLFPWCKKYGYMEIISQDNMEKGEFVDEVTMLLNQTWKKPVIESNGAEQVAQWITDALKI